ncbi:MAG: dienelactone hydrolase family protein [Mariniphaga sp.]|nr:dienelactone hydrolase family protein [Mariniphaga sp.]MDD4225194.1 dienelactone hydrolase family protein [Mariniphaga sp.]
MHHQIISLYGEYRKSRSDRRNFIKKLIKVTGSTALATAVLPVLENNTLIAAEKQQKIKDVIGGFMVYPAETGEMRGYLAKPSEGKKFPAVIVIHENRGLVPHIQDVTHQMAQEGFLSLAPDALSPVGGTPDEVSNVGELFGKLDNKNTIKNFVAAVKYLKTHPNSNGKVGCTGFCWGGAMTNLVAVNSPDLDAAVPYYGRVPESVDVPKINAPVMAHFAENDERINAGIEGFKEAMKKNGKELQVFIYTGTQHAFNNNTNPERYNEAAAKLAWERTIKFFRKELK